jgi:hypothetical protein
MDEQYRDEHDIHGALAKSRHCKCDYFAYIASASKFYNELMQYDQGKKRFLCLYQRNGEIAFDWLLNREQRTFGFIRDIYGSESSVTKPRLFFIYYI